MSEGRCWQVLSTWQLTKLGASPLRGCDCHSCQLFRQQGMEDEDPPETPAAWGEIPDEEDDVEVSG